MNANAYLPVYEPTTVPGVAVTAQVPRHGVVSNDIQTSGSLPPHNTFDGW